jgi:hypothetical protein
MVGYEDRKGEVSYEGWTCPNGWMKSIPLVVMHLWPWGRCKETRLVTHT